MVGIGERVRGKIEEMQRGSVLVGLFFLYIITWFSNTCIVLYVSGLNVTRNMVEILFYTDMLYALGLFQQLWLFFLLGLLIHAVLELER